MTLASLGQAVRALWPILVIGLVAAVGFAALGIWQVERLGWKNQLIAAVEARSTGTPLDLDAVDWTEIDPAENAYQRVTVTGRMGADVALVQAVTVLGGGFWAMAPLELADGRRLLVNRGFVASATDQHYPPAEGAVTVTGLMRESEPGGGFLRSNDPENGRWFSRDVAAIGSRARLDGLPDFFIDADEMPGDAARGGLTVLSFSNNHLIYALTWFALSAFMLGALGYVVRDRLRQQD